MLRTGLALALVAVAGLSACNGSETDRPDDRDHYVAIGDSYTAAPLIGSTDSNDGCLRSRTNYPHLVAEAEGFELDDVSCSGAGTDAVRNEQHTKQTILPPQLDAVDEGTDLVTIGLGFNDFGLTLITFLTCPKVAERNAKGAPCTAADEAAGAAGVDGSLRRLDKRIAKAVRAVREKAPDAQVMVIGYPEVFPAKRACDNYPVANGDLPLVRKIIRGINKAAEAAAERHDATFVDVYGPSRGHDLCSEDPWFAGNEADPDRKGLIWHPYAEEQELVAELVREQLD